MIKTLKKMPYANAHVEIEDNGTVVLVSYKTAVVIIDKDGWMTVTGLYSPTTRRHISRFMDEYTTKDFYFAKKLYTDGVRYNVKTGEVMKIE